MLDHIVKTGNWHESVEMHFLVSAVVTWIFRNLMHLTKEYPNSHRDMELILLNKINFNLKEVN